MKADIRRQEGFEQSPKNWVGREMRIRQAQDANMIV